MITIGVLFGGKSGEHEVSRCSAASAFLALDRSKYKVIAIGIDYDGRWYPQKDPVVEKDPAFGQVLALSADGDWRINHFDLNSKLVLTEINSKEEIVIDCVMPVVHGTNCEDGTLQGLLDLCGVPYTGAGVLGSSVSMDKDATKRMLRDGGVPVTDWISVSRNEWRKSKEDLTKRCEEMFGYPFFVKPANAGSSVGVHKIKDRSEAVTFIDDSLRYDLRVIVEPAVDCREIECAVIGNDDPQASVLGEVIPSHEFYSYEAKYIDADGAKLAIPANIDKALSDKIRACAVKAYSILRIEGLARVDFFIDKKTGSFYLNEPNTLPGFTSISMYPKLWNADGVSYSQLLDKLIELAFERLEARKTIETRFYGK